MDKEATESQGSPVAGLLCIESGRIQAFANSAHEQIIQIFWVFIYPIIKWEE
jgi:hypothetical protein